MHAIGLNCVYRCRVDGGLLSEREPRVERLLVIAYSQDHFTAGVRLLDQTAQAAIKGKKKAQAGTEAMRLEIVAEFAAHYRLRAGADADALRPALEEFGRCNVGLHVWPYWREYVQNTCARLGIPIIPIGMYSLPKVQGAPESDE